MQALSRWLLEFWSPNSESEAIPFWKGSHRTPWRNAGDCCILFALLMLGSLLTCKAIHCVTPYLWAHGADVSPEFAFGVALMILIIPFCIFHVALVAFAKTKGADADSKEQVDDAVGIQQQQVVASHTPYLWLLDPVRFCAMLYIQHYHDHPFTSSGQWGFVWCSFFFVLSGFVNAYQYMTEPTKQFTWNRVTKLWPAYFLYIVLALADDDGSHLLLTGYPWPTYSGAKDAFSKLCSFNGFLYVFGLQTLLPFEPQFQWVSSTCWFIPTLLWCQSLTPMWLNGFRLLPVEDQRRSSMGTLCLVCSLALVIPVAGALWEAYAEEPGAVNLFWVLRYSPFTHWAQLCLGVCTALAFLKQCSTIVRQDAVLRPYINCRCSVWVVSSAAMIGVMCYFVSKVTITNEMIVALNGGVMSSVFAVMIFTMSCACLLAPSHPVVESLTKPFGDICFLAYLFLPRVRSFLLVHIYWYTHPMGWSQDTAFGVAFVCSVPALMLLRFLVGRTWGQVKSILSNQWAFVISLTSKLSQQTFSKSEQ